MTNRRSTYVKSPIVTLFAALCVAATGCASPADAAEAIQPEPAAEAAAELAASPGATHTIRTAVLYLQDAGHVAGTLAVGELTDPAGPDYSEAINYIDEASIDLTTARALLVARERLEPAELHAKLAELGARQAARAERLARRRQ